MEFHSQRLPVATLLLPFPSYWATSLSLPEVCISGVTLHRMVLSCMFPGSLLTIPSPPARPQNVDSYLLRNSAATCCTRPFVFFIPCSISCSISIFLAHAINAHTCPVCIFSNPTCPLSLWGVELEQSLFHFSAPCLARPPFLSCLLWI